MDFVRYSEVAAALVNARLDDADSLADSLAGTPADSLADRMRRAGDLTGRDLVALRRFQHDLREVFVSSAAGRAADVVAGVNRLLAGHPVTPYVSDHDAGHLHLHVAAPSASGADRLVAESLFGLANLVCELGPTRLGICRSRPCLRVFVDSSPNASRRYCSERCSSRANVAAYRARQRALAGR